MINVYDLETHKIDWHSDSSYRWGATDAPADIYSWYFGAHGVFEIGLAAGTTLARKVTGSKDASISTSFLSGVIQSILRRCA